MTFEEAKQQAIDRSEWVLCHGADYYTARTPDGRDIIGKGENGVFVGGEYRRTGDKDIKGPELEEYVRHRLSLFEPTGFCLDDVILGPAKQPTEGKVFGNVIEECLEAFFSACCEDVKYTQSQEYFADFAENNEFEFYENGIRIRHR